MISPREGVQIEAWVTLGEDGKPRVWFEGPRWIVTHLAKTMDRDGGFRLGSYGGAMGASVMSGVMEFLEYVPDAKLAQAKTAVAEERARHLAHLHEHERLVDELRRLVRADES